MNPAIDRPADRSKQPPLRQQLVVQIARRLSSQSAFVANDAAPRRSDEQRVHNSGTYAFRRIETATFDDLRSIDALPPESRPRHVALRTAVQRLEHRLGRAPRAKDVADELGWTLAALHRCMLEAGGGALRAGDAPLPDGAVSAPLPAVPPAALPMPADLPCPAQLVTALDAAFEMLADREQFVLELVYVRGLCFGEIGLTLGVTGAHATRIHDGAVAKMLGRVIADGGVRLEA